jgi:hypothetical protein
MMIVHRKELAKHTHGLRHMLLFYVKKKKKNSWFVIITTETKFFFAIAQKNPQTRALI